MRLSARQVKDALASRHAKDVFFTEVKSGESWGRKGTLHILDAWAMKISWASPCAYGYEIKVSRSDFLRDDKWKAYLDMCNQFYFVCPWKMIEKSEVPDGVGLMYVMKDGKKTRIVKKAKFRTLEVPVDLLKYLLFYRTNQAIQIHKGVGYWKAYLEGQSDLQDIGHACSKKIQRELHDLRKQTNENTVSAEKLEKAEKVLELYFRLTGHRLLGRYRQPDERILAQAIHPVMRILTRTISELNELQNTVLQEDLRERTAIEDDDSSEIG